MSNKKNENNGQNNLDKDSLKNLTNNVLNNQNSLDLNSIMRVAANLLGNDSIMNSINELNKRNQPPAESTVPENQENAELASLAEQLEKIANGFLALQKELLELKEQNQNLTKLVKKLYKNNSKNK